MNKDNYTLDVLVNGRPVAEHTKDGKFLIEAREGTEYSLRFKNNTSKRVMAVFSVDGIDVLKGKIAEEADTGYIIDAYSSGEIKGYRIDDKSVASFKFGSKGVSYAVTVGGTKTKKDGKEVQIKTDKNNGVIGVRVFEEDVPVKPVPTKEYIYVPVKEYVPVWSTPKPWPYWGEPQIYPSYTCGGGTAMRGGGDGFDAAMNCSDSIGDTVYQNMSFADSASASKDFAQKGIDAKEVLKKISVKPDFDLGTSWGSKVQDEVRHVEFKARSISVDLVIYYATRQQLSEYGIDFSNKKKIAEWPSAFGKGEYCKTPPGYQS